MFIFSIRIFSVMYILCLCIRGWFLRFCAYTFQYSHRYCPHETAALVAVVGALRREAETRRKYQRERMNMRSTIIAGIAALAVGTALASAPAFAQSRSAPTYSNTGPNNGAPLSPNGIGAAPSSFGGPGPGYIGPQGARATAAGYSNAGPFNSAPLSPNGIGAAPDSFGGPSSGYIGPSGGRAPAPYSNVAKSGAPLSPNGIGAAPSSFGGPGYNSN